MRYRCTYYNYFGQMNNNVWTTNGCFLKGLECWENRVKTRNRARRDGDRENKYISNEGLFVVKVVAAITSNA